MNNIMEGPIVKAADQISSTAIAAVGHQLGYFINYKRNIEKLKTEVKKLNDARDRVKHAVEAANRNGENTEVDVQNWLAHADDITDKVEKFFDEGQAKMMEAEGWCPNLKSRYQLSRKATKMAQVVVAETPSEGKFNKVAYRPAPQGLTHVASSIGTTIDSRMSTLKEIMEALKDPNINMIGVYGLSGVGKTTLVKEVATKAKEEKLFDLIIMVSVKENPDPERIQGEMADKLGLKFDEQTVTGRADRLCDRIKKEENILVILTDLWEKLDLEEVGVPFGDAHKGCKILLTSRTRNVLTIEMGTQKNFELVALSQEEAWSLFKKYAGDVRGDPDLQSVANEVAKRCTGLPSLIVAVAKALKGKDLHVWKGALKDLDLQTEAKAKVYAALQLSYNNLSADVKSVFLLCGLLPKYDIAIGCLFEYAMGLGLLYGLTFEDARNKLHRLIDDLKGKCLLLDSETNEEVKMHDFVHDFVVLVASKERHVCTKDWPKKDILEKCTMISLPSSKIQELPERLECPELELISLGKIDDHEKIPDTFLMVKTDATEYEIIPETFFKGMKNLKVMALSTMHLMSLPSLQFLKKLKMLCLDCCVLGEIAIIGELKGLEILRLTKCDLVELPKEIGQLTCLRLLDLSDNPKLQVIPAGVISSMKHLEELYMTKSFAQWEVEEINSERSNASLSEFKHLSKLTTLKVDMLDAKTFPKDLILEKLERYLIFIGKWSESDKGMDVTSRTLKLKSNSSLQLENGIKMLLKKADSLYLAELNGIEGIMDELKNKGYKQLKELRVQNNAEIQYIINSRERAPCITFPVLESIFLGSLSNLEKICHGQLPVGSFRKLRIVKVEHCHRLKYLLSLSAVPGGFAQLQELEINECRIMSAIFAEEREDEIDGAMDVREFPELRSLTLDLPKLIGFCFLVETPFISSCTQKSRSLFNQKVSFPKLEALNLCSINLEKIWDENLLGSACFKNLTRLIIESCGNLKYLISSSNETSLAQLNYLEICNCLLMEEVVTMELCEDRRLNKMFPKLEILRLKDLPNLSRFCAESLIELPLKELQIINCPEMKTFISKSSSNDIEPFFNESVAFPNLEILLISKMVNLEMIWHNNMTEGSFCNLRNMTVMDCEKLQTIFPPNLLRRFRNLETLHVGDCYSLEEIFTNPGKKLKEKHVEVAFKLGFLRLIDLPKLNHIWNENFPGSHTFKNLSLIDVVGCLNLKYLIPASMVAYGLEDEGRRAIVFPKVTNLYLRRLAKLKSIYPNILASKWPSLIRIEVQECDKLRIFASDILSFPQVHFDGGLESTIEQPLFLVEKDTFPELKELKLTKNDAMKEIWHGQVQDEFFPKLEVLKLKCFPNKSAVFPPGFLHTLKCLEKLVVRDTFFKDIFQYERFAAQDGKLKLLKEAFQHLETLKISECVKFKMLVPSSITLDLHSLTTLEVNECHGLVNLVTSSTARSLVQLITLSITECNEIREIIADNGGEAEEEISFNQLKYLELRYLSNLTSFYSGRCSIKFPSLEGLFVEQCPKMNDLSLGLLSARNVERAKGDEMALSKGTSKTTFQSLQLIDDDEEEDTPITSKLPHKKLNESSKETEEEVTPITSKLSRKKLIESSKKKSAEEEEEEEVTPLTSKLSHIKLIECSKEQEEEKVTLATSKLSHKKLIESSKEVEEEEEEVTPATSKLSHKKHIESSKEIEEEEEEEEEVTPATSKLSYKKLTESSKEKTPKSSTPSPAHESVKLAHPETIDSNDPLSFIEEDDMEAFYASVGAMPESCQPTSMDGTTHAQCKNSKPDQVEIDKALEVVNNVLATRFSFTCASGFSSSFKFALELLCRLDEHDGISIGMKSLVLQLSKDFEMMTKRFDWANEKIERHNKLIQSMADIEFQLIENKEKFLNLSSVESDILISISEAEGQIKKLQQQINSLTMQRNLAEQEKKATFVDGKKLKDKWNVDVKKAGNAEKEKEIAERTKDELEEKWSGFSKQFLYFQKLNLMQISKS